MRHTFWSVAVFVVLLATGASSARAADRVEVLRAPAGPGIVLGPERAERMEVTVDGRTLRTGRFSPLGNSRLGHAVTAIALPAGVRAGDRVVVRIRPAQAGTVRIVPADENVVTAVDAARASGIMMGILFAVLVLLATGYTITREPSIPFFGIFVVMLLVVETLRDQMFGWERGANAPSLLMLIDLINAMAHVGFVIVFLRLLQQGRKLAWLLALMAAPGVIVGTTIALLPGLHVDIETTRPVLMFLGLFGLFGVTMYRALQGFTPAWFLSAAMLPLSISIAYRAIRATTGFADPFLDRWLYEIGSSLDAILFGVAIIARARYLVERQHVMLHRIDEATHAAHHDVLTGALNRRGLFGLNVHDFGSLFFIDLDGFKEINDRYGHGAGDIVLTAVASELRNLAGDDGVVARLGGDEFVVLAQERAPARLAMMADRVSDAIERLRPAEAKSAERFGASIGFVSLGDLALEAAIRLADIHAYRVKTGKRTSLVG